MGRSTFLLKSLLVLWIVCAVLVSCEHQKRDVHRIVIHHRIPRSQKKGNHNYNYSHHRNSSRNHGHKKGKKHGDSHEKDSFEDNDESRSSESNSSSEEVFKKAKDHKSHHRHHNSKTYPNPHYPPIYHVNHHYEEPKQIPFKDDSNKYMFHNEWIPLSSEQVHHGSSEMFRDRYNKKKRNSSKGYLTSLKPPPIDLTTSYPFHFETSSIFPQLIGYPNAFYSFDLNKKIMESNQAPLIGTIEQPTVQFSEIKDNYKLKNHRTSYEVTELTPAGSNTNTIITVLDEDNSEHSAEEHTTKSSSKYKKEEMKSTQKPMRSRGRVTYRGQNKS